MSEKEYKGYNGTLILTEIGITIKRGLKGAIGSGKLRGDKTIPYQVITAVQLKKAGMTAGYLQLTIQGGREANGLLQAVRDENTVAFYNWSNAAFTEAKNLIEEKIIQAQRGQLQQPIYMSLPFAEVPTLTQPDRFAQLEKLAELHQKGILTEEEFTTKKAQMLQQI